MRSFLLSSAFAPVFSAETETGSAQPETPAPAPAAKPEAKAKRVSGTDGQQAASKRVTGKPGAASPAAKPNNKRGNKPAGSAAKPAASAADKAARDIARTVRDLDNSVPATSETLTVRLAAAVRFYRGFANKTTGRFTIGDVLASGKSPDYPGLKPFDDRVAGLAGRLASLDLLKRDRGSDTFYLTKRGLTDKLPTA